MFWDYLPDGWEELLIRRLLTKKGINPDKLTPLQKLTNLDYHHLMQVVQTICRPEEMYEAFKRMCFNLFYKNKNDHGKNFSFLYDEELKSYKLSPAYDITSTPTKFEHEMTVNGNGNPTEEDLMFIAKHFKLSRPTCRKIIKEIKNRLKI